MRILASSGPLIALGVVAAAACVPVLALAQVSRPVVQALPSEASQTLTRALRNLARNPRSLPDLVDAGEAALELEDGEAALGFFLRAEEVQPAYGRATAGRAAALVLLERPVEALSAFALAQQNGAVMSRFDKWHGLAWDLVGDNQRAQGYYRSVLARGPDAVVSRRLALSLAISGQAEEMDAVLLPLLQAGDIAAYRTRAFALAILGKTDEAVSISSTILPARIAAQIEPYLRYMPRLTRAQQAAAANLGSFPAATSIGIDSPEIAAYSRAAGPVQVARADNSGDRLTPSGRALGRTDRAEAEPPRRESRRERRERERRERESREAGGATIGVVQALPPTPLATEPEPEPVQVAEAPAAVPPASASADVTAAPPRTELPAVAAAQPAVTTAVAGPPVAEAEPEAGPATAPQFDPEPQPVVVARMDQPSTAASATTTAGPSITLDQVPPPAPVEQANPPAPQGLADAFSDFSLPAGESTRPATGAVDITAIEPARETPPPAQAAPGPPPNPSRHWVQVATGRDVSALRFDWRRISRGSGGALDGKSAFTAPWGQTNRLVTGPYDSAADANAAVRALKEEGVDAFRFTSAAGEAVTPLD
ncbi:SPOR domain-containing protein [Paraurantiacibacter namhicola]|uniref:Sporulation related domain protein n=1 Tax=Paraurantiacibacter namhicola TaxID=645517 RepID=A0A1C7DAU0_9SPHN|nr:SPOR domain-containing protein [Paraurantiacibacter namhicola]ANU08537.1 Sporulation related domain protein [Paraurantiacibacter namhicola]